MREVRRAAAVGGLLRRPETERLQPCPVSSAGRRQNGQDGNQAGVGVPKYNIVWQLRQCNRCVPVLFSAKTPECSVIGRNLAPNQLRLGH